MGWQPYCNTIVTEADCWLGRQCHDTKICIVTEGLGLAGFWLQYKILYCDSGLGRRWSRRARARAQAALAWGARQRATGADTVQTRGGRAAGASMGAAALERVGRAGGRRAGRQARGATRCAAGRAERAGQGWLGGLGARAGQRLCTRCTRPVFGPVRLGIFPESNFWTLFVNPVHEHCSSQNFPKKKIY